MQTPATIYAPSTRAYIEELEYPFHDWTAVITTCGRICYQRRKINVSQVFAGQKVGVKQVDEHIWLVTFMQYDLGYFDDETCRLEPIDKPFGPKVSPLSRDFTRLQSLHILNIHVALRATEVAPCHCACLGEPEVLSCRTGERGPRRKARAVR